MIDATQPYITYNSDSYSSLNSTLSKVEIYYNMGDDHSGLANYTCEFKGDGTFSSDTSISSSGTSISSSGTSISSSGTSTSSSTGDTISTSTCTTSAAVTTSFSKGVYDYIGYKICATDKVGNTTKCITGTVTAKSNYSATASTSTYDATASTVNCGRWKLKFGSHYYHTCETCGYDIVNSGYASISGTPGSYCSSHYGTYHTKTTYSCPNGGTLSGTTCTITTYSCPDGGTLNESTKMCEF